MSLLNKVRDGYLNSEEYLEKLSKFSSYEYVTSTEKTKAVVKQLSKVKVLGIDTETTGLDPHTSEVRLVQIASTNNPTYIFDCFWVNISLLQPLLINPNIVKVYQNAKFDIKMFFRYGIISDNRVFDTMLASQVLNMGIRKKNDLRSLVDRYLGFQIEKEEQLSDWSVEKLTDKQLTYAAIDSKVLISLYGVMGKLLVDKKLVEVAKIEFKAVLGVAMIEYSGMAINKAKWVNLLGQLSEKLFKLADYIQEKLPDPQALFPITFNIDSNAQLKDRLVLNGFKVPSTGVEVLKAYWDKSPELFDALLEYRKIQKILSSFGDTLLDKVNPVTNRVHTSIKQLGAATGRCSCKSPNLQQIPNDKRVRSLFVPEKGNKLIVADYSQMELRIAAKFTNCKPMIEAYANNEDLHIRTAALILDKPESEVTKADRKIAKSAAFGLIYGSSTKGLIRYAKTTYGISLSDSEAEHIIKVFFGAYPELKNWHEKIRKSVKFNPKDNRYISTLSGRVRYIANPTPQQVLNTPIQGTGGDITKCALGDLAVLITKYDAWIIAVVHDEIVVECKENIAEDLALIIKDVMEKAAVPFIAPIPGEVETDICDSWADKS